MRVSRAWVVFFAASLALLMALAGCEKAPADGSPEEEAESQAPVERAEASTDKDDQRTPTPDEQPQEESEAKESDSAQKAPAVEPAGEDESAKRKDIRKLLVMTGSAKLGLQVMDQIIAQFKVAAPNVPSEFWAEFRKDISEDALLDLLVPIYDKHLTHNEVTKLIEFFQTPAGKSYVKKLPAITQESQIAGQKWGRDIAQKVQKRLQEKGYK